jgi:hypothetical protein
VQLADTFSILVHHRSGFCVSFTGEYRINLMVGFALWTVGVGLLSTLTADSGLGKIIGYQLLAGAGAGQTFQTGLVALQASVPRSQMAVVTALRKSVAGQAAQVLPLQADALFRPCSFVRLLGGTVALAIAQALLNNAVQYVPLIIGQPMRDTRPADPPPPQPQEHALFDGRLHASSD